MTRQTSRLLSKLGAGMVLAVTAGCGDTTSSDMSASAEHRTREAPFTAPRVDASLRYARGEHDGIDERGRPDGSDMSASAEHHTGEAPFTVPRVDASLGYERGEHDGIDERGKPNGGDMSASAEHHTGEAPFTVPRVDASLRYERGEHDGIDERGKPNGSDMSASAEHHTGEAPFTVPRVDASPEYERGEHDGIDKRDRPDGPELDGGAMPARAMPAAPGDGKPRKLSHTDITNLQERDDTETLHGGTDAAHSRTRPSKPVERPSEYRRRSRPGRVPSIDVLGHAPRRSRTSLTISPTMRSSSEQSADILNILPHFFHDTNFNPLEASGSTHGDTVATLEERPAAPLSARLRTWMREIHADFDDCRTMPCPHRESPQPWTTLFKVDARMRQDKKQGSVRRALEWRALEQRTVPVTPDAFDQLDQRDKLWVALRLVDAEVADNSDSLAWSGAAALFSPEALHERQHCMVVPWMLRMFDLRLDLVALGERGARPGELDAFVRAAARDVDRQDRLEQLEQALHALAVYEIVPRMRSILEPTSAQLHEVARTTFRVVEALERLAAEVAPTSVQQGSDDTDYADRFNQLLSGTI